MQSFCSVFTKTGCLETPNEEDSATRQLIGSKQQQRTQFSDIQDFEAFLLNRCHSWNLELLSITIISNVIPFQSSSRKHNWSNEYLIVSETEQTLIFK